jgi:hypothetical protein
MFNCAVASKLSKIFSLFHFASLSVLSYPFCWGCKGKSFYFISQIYLKIFQTFFAVKIAVRTTVFFKRTAKIRAYFLVPNFI